MIRPALPLLAILLAAAAPPATQVQPGRWRYSVTILDAQMPGAPAGMAATMRGHATTMESCLTAAQAAAGPRGVAERSGGNCRFTRFDQNGPHITGTMVCNSRGGSMTVQSDGTYTPAAIDITGHMTGQNGMRLTTRTTGHRVGAC